MAAESETLRRRIPRAVRAEFRRETLLGRLTAHDGPLIALVAPGGYGKSTLLAQYARQHAGRTVWLSLSEDDGDPLVLCAHLVGAVSERLPTLPLTHWHAARAAGASAEGLARALAADLNASTTNFDLMLDGSERLQAAAGDTLARLLDTLTEGHRLLLAGRAEPPLDLAGRVARGDALLLGLRDLRFSRAESAALLGSLPDAEAQTAHERLEGWPVGVALVGSGAAPELTPADLIRGALGRLPAELRRALPAASVLEVWGGAHPDQGELHLPPGWLDELRRAGLPLAPLGGSFRPHALLQEVLEEELRRDPARHRELHLDRGAQAEAEGDRLRALTHYLAAGEQGRALALAAVLTDEYENRWEYPLVRLVLERIGERQLPPDLRGLYAYALFETGEPVRGEALLYQLRQSGEHSPCLSLSLAVLAAWRGQPQETLRYVEEGLALGHLTPREQRRLLLRKTSALWRTGQPDEAVRTGEQVARLSQDARDLVTYASALVNLQWVYYDQGRKAECERAIREALDIYTRLDMPSRMLALQADLAELLGERGEFAGALGLLDRALEYAHQQRRPEHPAILEMRADVLLRQHQLQQALGEYRLAWAAYRQGVPNTPLVQRLALRLGELALELRQPAALEEALAWLLDNAASPTVALHLELLRGLRAGHDQAWEDARSLLAHVSAEYLHLDLPFRFRALAYHAQAQLQTGTFGAQAAEDLDRRLAPSSAADFVPLHAPLLERLGAACRSSGWACTSLERLLAGLSALPTEPGSPAARRLSLEVRTLGALRVTLEGQPIHIPLSKSAEVLAWLALSGHGSRDQIIDALWDGSNERRHVEYFKVAVRHLRLALSAHPAVTFNPLPFEEGRYRLAGQFAVTLDATRAEQALADATPTALSAALDAYQGAFLPGAEPEWAADLRLRALEATVAAALTLGSLLEHTDQTGAARAYERAAQLDPLNEDAYQRLLALHARQGNATAVRHTYQRYARMLADEWRRQPDPHWQALAQQTAPRFPGSSLVPEQSDTEGRNSP